MPYINLSDNDIEKKINSNYAEIFREYKKNNNHFIATNNFFQSDNNVDNPKFIKIYGKNNENFIEKINNTYIIHYDIDYNEQEIIRKTKEINLMIIKNLDLEINTDLIDIKNIINNNNINVLECDELLKDLYFDTYYFNKFNIKLEDNNIFSKKYLFKIKRGEMNVKTQIEKYNELI